MAKREVDFEEISIALGDLGFEHRDDLVQKAVSLLEQNSNVDDYIGDIEVRILSDSMITNTLVREYFERDKEELAFGIPDEFLISKLPELSPEVLRVLRDNNLLEQLGNIIASLVELHSDPETFCEQFYDAYGIAGCFGVAEENIVETQPYADGGEWVTFFKY